MKLSDELKEKYKSKFSDKINSRGASKNETDIEILLNILSPEFDRFNSKILDLQGKVEKLENKKCGCKTEKKVNFTPLQELNN